MSAVARGSVSSPVKVGDPAPTVTDRGQQVLVGNVTGAKFSYFGSPREGVPAKWQDEWKDASRLPRIVALRADVELNRRMETFDLMFRIFSD